MVTAFAEDMNVVAHEGPPVNGAFAFDDEFAQSFQETRLVLVVL